MDDSDDEKPTKRIRHEDSISRRTLTWKKISAQNLDVDYTLLYGKKEADRLFQQCEEDIEYYSGDLSKVFVFGKWHNIPRKQVAFGDENCHYKFSGTVISAKPWIPIVEKIRDQVSCVTGKMFNFVLVNRYKDGKDHIGKHKDDEVDLISDAPIASLSLGEQRDFIFHEDKKKQISTKQNQIVKVSLEHGSLLIMNTPTNHFWYHSLPPRKKSHGVRINFTFRQMVVR